MSVWLNMQATSVMMQRGKNFCYALPLYTAYQSLEFLKKF